MKIHNKIPLVMIGSILLIANAIPIGKYLSQDQKVNDATKTISSKETYNNNHGKEGTAQTLPTNKLGKTSTPSTPFAAIGPTTNLKIKVTSPGVVWGISKFTYFLKYFTWEKEPFVHSDGVIMPTWTAVSHEVTVGGLDVKNIEVAGTKIADTEIRVKSSGKGWAKLVANKDLKWPKGVKSTLANTTFSIDSAGTQFNPSASFYYHIKGYDKLKIASYDVFSFSQWLMNHLVSFIIGLVALCIAVISIIAICVLLGTDTALVASVDVEIATQLIEAEEGVLAEALNEESAVAVENDVVDAINGADSDVEDSMNGIDGDVENADPGYNYDIRDLINHIFRGDCNFDHFDI